MSNLPYSKSSQLKKNNKDSKSVKKFRMCRYCKEKTVPYGSIQPFCFKNECIRKHNKETIRKKKVKEKAKLNSEDRQYQLKLAEKAFNPYIRERDRDLPCVSCGYVFKAIGTMRVDDIRQAHAGHFRPAGNHAILRFNEDNVWKQCSVCNTHKSGNVGAFERELRRRIGDERVDYLLNTNTPYKHTIEELKGIQALYKKKLKQLKKESF